jgi:hypothetical protein
MVRETDSYRDKDDGQPSNARLRWLLKTPPLSRTVLREEL